MVKILMDEIIIERKKSIRKTIMEFRNAGIK